MKLRSLMEADKKLLWKTVGAAQSQEQTSPSEASTLIGPLLPIRQFESVHIFHQMQLISMSLKKSKMTAVTKQMRRS